jgi:hypothetical protein
MLVRADWMELVGQKIRYVDPTEGDEVVIICMDDGTHYEIQTTDDHLGRCTGFELVKRTEKCTA